MESVCVGVLSIIELQYKLHTKWNSHNTTKYLQYKVTLMYMVLFSPRASP